MEANEENIKNKEKVKSLLLLLQAAYEERDEARDQLQKLMNKFMPTTATELPALLHFQPESPLNIPQKGKLLQAVTEAGPLLQTLLVAGPLPQWRNPPPLQAFKIPPLLVNGRNTKNIDQNPPSKSSSPSPKPLHSLLHTEMSRGSSQICSAASMLSFTNGPSGSCFNSALLMAPNVNRPQIMSSSPPPPSPVPDYSSWSPWSISTIAIVCIFFLLLSNYRILKRLFRGVISGRPRVENPTDPSPQIHGHGLEASRIHLLPNCNHSFHSSCIDAWFRDHSSCPLCRLQISSFSLDFSTPDSSLGMLETLGRENVLRERVPHYQTLRAQNLQHSELRRDASVQGSDQ